MEWGVRKEPEANVLLNEHVVIGPPNAGSEIDGFDTLEEAVTFANAYTSLDFNNQVTIISRPGQFSVDNPLILDDYVNYRGSGFNTTRILANTSSSDLFQISGNHTLMDFTGANSTTAAIIELTSGSGTVYMKNVGMLNAATGISKVGLHSIFAENLYFLTGITTGITMPNGGFVDVTGGFMSGGTTFMTQAAGTTVISNYLTLFTTTAYETTGSSAILSTQASVNATNTTVYESSAGGIIVTGNTDIGTTTNSVLQSGTGNVSITGSTFDQSKINAANLSLVNVMGFFFNDLEMGTNEDLRVFNDRPVHRYGFALG